MTPRMTEETVPGSGPGTGGAEEVDLHDSLRQMLAVLEAERQALAGLDLDAIVGTTRDKDRLCAALDVAGQIDPLGDLDEECRGMLETARRLNEVNRQVRNIIAANVARRLNTLTGAPQLYRAGGNYALVARTGGGRRAESAVGRV
ncbi:hypothetical protein EDF57_103265 [Novosphingobium sp. PhB55]|uniref:flagellar protein FlgN n=1 Tax=Novosphingobium sp. PhB55 TaxID=2485106 RepID=UPI0010EC9511|nr:hypothetical protein EDF57_103265 [Novosphingobium sp. PhB55]